MLSHTAEVTQVSVRFVFHKHVAAAPVVR